jgi:hypothetical protein
MAYTSFIASNEVMRVLSFENVKKWFDQDEELSKNYELFGSLLVVDNQHSVVAIIT